MSPDHADSQLSSVQDATVELTWQRPSMHDYALLEELCFVRREAQAEATLAYQDWRDRPCDERYTVYVAAQDRADAAQDQLASWSQKIAA